MTVIRLIQESLILRWWAKFKKKKMFGCKPQLCHLPAWPPFSNDYSFLKSQFLFLKNGWSLLCIVVTDMERWSSHSLFALSSAHLVECFMNWAKMCEVFKCWYLFNQHSYQPVTVCSLHSFLGDHLHLYHGVNFCLFNWLQSVDTQVCLPTWHF